MIQWPGDTLATATGHAGNGECPGEVKTQVFKPAKQKNQIRATLDAAADWEQFN